MPNPVKRFRTATSRPATSGSAGGRESARPASHLLCSSGLQQFAVQLNRNVMGVPALAQEAFLDGGMHGRCGWVNDNAIRCRQNSNKKPSTMSAAVPKPLAKKLSSQATLSAPNFTSPKVATSHNNGLRATRK
jgi:hypothetical protein